MWEINLVRYRLKSFKKGKVAKLFIYGEIFLFLITLFVLNGRYFHISHKIEQMEKNLESLQKDYIGKIGEGGSERVDLEEIKQEWKRLGDKLSLVNTIMEERILWAPKLQPIAESIPSNICLQKIYASEKTIDKKKVKVLVMKGSIQAPAEDVLSHINKFINQLKENPLLKEQISKFERASVSKPKLTEDQKTISDFELLCYLK